MLSSDIVSSLVSKEPLCLTELERIQALDGGKRKFGRYRIYIVCLPTPIGMQGLVPARSSVIALIQPERKAAVSVCCMSVRAGEYGSVFIWTCVRFCASYRIWLTGRALSQDSPRTQSDEQAAKCSRDRLNVLFCFASADT